MPKSKNKEIVTSDERINIINERRNNMIVQYSRDEKGSPDGVLVAEKAEENTVLIGWSACQKPDHFNKARALQIATGRIKLGASGGVVPRRMRDMIAPFTDRCRRYFKTDCVILVGSSDEIMHVR